MKAEMLWSKGIFCWFSNRLLWPDPSPLFDDFVICAYLIRSRCTRACLATFKKTLVQVDMLIE